MKLYQPSYMDDFKCIADQCRDSCCIGWEIAVDDDTAAKYDAVSGPFGERLRNAMTNTKNLCFCIDEQERCPFLNEKNLCDIILQMGESALCQICRDHPRFYNWFPDCKECGIGLCCEEAARLILSTPHLTVSYEVSDEQCDTDFDIPLLHLLRNAREIIIAHLLDENVSLHLQLCRMIQFTDQLQYNYDNDVFDLPDWEYTPAETKPWDATQLLSLLETLEAMDDTWHSDLYQCNEHLAEIEMQLPAFRIAHPETNSYLRNIAVYFIRRYFVNGASEGEFLSYAKFSVIAVLLCERFFCHAWLSHKPLSLTLYADIAKQFSKEIEYNEENLSVVLDATYELPCLATKTMTEGLFEMENV